jgi:hypothetical protein
MQSIGSATNVARAEGARESSNGAQTMPSVAGTDTADENIAKLAYALWQYRGCPIGSPELDWAEAESQLRRPAGRL